MHITILGIDGGFLRLGASVIEQEGEKLTLRAPGLITNPRDPKLTFNEYLNAGIHLIVDTFPRILGMYTPDYVASETIPVGRLGANTELVVAAVTTCKVIAYQFGIPWIDIPANTVKKAVTDNGRASKVVIRNAVCAVFPELADRHEIEKKTQKEAGQRATGLPADVFDSVAVALAGLEKIGKGL